jgi:diguanylate cyclase (GGDEF)-like protein/PAS domain S-box-containing protein
MLISPTSPTRSTSDAGTDREWSAQALRESQERLADAYALTGLAWWEFRVESGRLSWSDGMRRLVGLSDDAELRIEDWVALVDPDDQRASTPKERAALEDGTPYLHVFRVRLPSGEVRHLQAWTGPLRDADGRIIGLRGATLDVTERQLAQEALSASEQDFRIAFDNAPIGMATIDLTADRPGMVLRANTAFARLLGREPDEVRALRLEDWTPTTEVGAELRRLRRLAGGATSADSYDRRFVRQDGSIGHVWVTTAVVTDAAGRPLYAVAHFIDDTERRLQQLELERLARTDVLTGLANRGLLNDRLTRSLSRLDRDGGVVGLLVLDLDRFKLVNDSLGHPIGDALLVEVARRLESVTRSDTTVARLGGDEFALLIEHAAGVEAIEAVAERALAALRQPFISPFGDVLTTTCSIGIAATADPGQSAEDLLRQADLALFHAKDTGRDRLGAYDDELHARTLDRVETESRLRLALRDGSLRVHLQPIVNLATNEVEAAEALVRVADPVRGDTLPPGLIGVAEESGLIWELDGWVLEEVVRQLAAAEADRRAGAHVPTPRTVAVNVSGRTLEHPAFVARTRDALARHGVAGHRLRIELTESTLLSSRSSVTSALAQLDELGVKVGIDDFGTGYSALAYLQHFPLGFLKIDISFVRQLGTPRADSVVAAIIQLAHAHDLSVTAEGVETPEQAAALRAMGCDHGQGWLFGRPTPLAAALPASR